MEKIYHCANDFRQNKQRRGGVQTYIKSLLRHQENVSPEVFDLFAGCDQQHFGLLHIHSPRQLSKVAGQCPTVFTLHNHALYCPSGTKYFFGKQTTCQRPMSYLGCSWGRIVGGCGSTRPGRTIQDFQTSYGDLHILKRQQIPIITVSEYARQRLINQGLPPAQATTILHGIEPPKSGVAPLDADIYQAQRLLFVGRLVPDKGLGWLLKALAKTPAQVQLDVAGEGWQRPQLESLANQLKIADRITWHGWCEKEKLNQLYTNCLAVVFPSVWPEPAGLITLEAYARRRPIIASQTGGIPEYVRVNQTGLLVCPNRIDDLAEAIITVCTDLPRATDLAERGYEYFQAKFSINHHVQKLQRFYGEVIGAFRNTAIPVSLKP